MPEYTAAWCDPPNLARPKRTGAGHPWGGNSVTKLRTSDGANLGTFATGTGPFGVAFDGTSIWVANIDSNTDSKL